MYLRGLITGIEKVCLWGGGGYLLLDVLVSLSHKHLFTVFKVYRFLEFPSILGFWALFFQDIVSLGVLGVFVFMTLQIL